MEIAVMRGTDPTRRTLGLETVGSWEPEEGTA